MKRWKLIPLLVVVSVAHLHLVAAFTDEELSLPPSPARLAGIERAAASSGWGKLAAPLRAVAYRAYETNSQSAEAWFSLSRWAALFGATDSDFVTHWSDAIKAGHLWSGGAEENVSVSNQPLSRHVSPALQAWLLANPDFSAEFFSLVSPYDLLPRSFDILSALQARYPKEFGPYANLALAIALVYDVPPPPGWPHGQVKPAALPRRLPDPAAAFGFWVNADENGRTLLQLSRLPASQLKFVIDTPTPLTELLWAQINVTIPLPVFAKAYDIVRYRVDRVQQGQYVWPSDSYELPTIVKEGGICVDQAYFACEVGKAKGIPTLFFSGAGRDAWHAWFGYLDQNHQWQLDAGRYTNQQLVTGFALDPQTWGVFSDHEVKFLAEGFRLLPSWRLACMNADFAAAYLADGNPRKAARAARVAINYDPRHLGAWDTLLTAQTRLGAPPMDRENLLREMKLAFQNYPDIEAPLVHQIAASMRARGEGSAADFEEHQFAQKVGPVRSDLNLDQDVQTMQNSMDHDLLDTQLRTYYALLGKSGKGAGIEYFDRIVRPFVLHLQQLNYRREAQHAALQAQNTLHIEPDSELDMEMRQLLNAIPLND